MKRFLYVFSQLRVKSIFSALGLLLCMVGTVYAEGSAYASDACAQLEEAGVSYQEARKAAMETDADYKRAAHTYDEGRRKNAERAYRKALDQLHKAELHYTKTVKEVADRMLEEAYREVAGNAQARHAEMRDARAYADGYHDTTAPETRTRMETRHREYMTAMESSAQQHQLRLDDHYRTSLTDQENRSLNAERASEDGELQSKRDRQGRELEERRAREGH